MSISEDNENSWMNSGIPFGGKWSKPFTQLRAARGTDFVPRAARNALIINKEEQGRILLNNSE